MAEREPRFYTANLVTNTLISTLSVSSEDISAPRALLRTPFHTERWRSSGPWVIVPGFNDRFEFFEGASLRTASITPGVYVSSAAFTTALQTAINAAAVSNTYSIAYGSTPLRFTITRATGATGWALAFATGTLAAQGRSAAREMGFTETDHNGLTTSVTSDGNVVQGRHYIKVSTGIQIINGIHLIGHNFSAAATIKANANAAGVYPPTGTFFNQQLTRGNSRPNQYGYNFTSGLATSFLRLTIDDITNPVGYAEVGVLMMASGYIPSRGMAQGYTETFDDQSLLARGASGAWFTVRRGAGDDLAFEFRNLARSGDRTTLRTLLLDLGVGGHFVLATDPYNHPVDDSLYGVLTSKPAFQQHVGDGAEGETDRYNVSFGFSEEIQ